MVFYCQVIQYIIVNASMIWVTEISLCYHDGILDIYLYIYVFVRIEWKKKFGGQESPLKLKHHIDLCLFSSAMMMCQTQRASLWYRSSSQNPNARQPDNSVNQFLKQDSILKLPKGGCISYPSREGHTIFQNLH